MTIIGLNKQTSNKIRNTQYLNEVLNGLSDRQVSYIIYLISMDRPPLIDLRDIQKVNLKEGLKQRLLHLDKLKDYIDEKIVHMKANLLPESEFDWLRGDLRKQMFCIDVLEKNHLYHVTNPTHTQEPLNLIYMYMDSIKTKNNNGEYFSVSLDKKANILRTIKQNFNAIKDNENYSIWLKKEDSKQIEWTQNYLKKLNSYYSHPSVDVNDNETIRDSVLLSLDLIYLVQYSNGIVIPSAAEKKLFLDKMKKAWSQKKFREAGKTKKPYHLPLTKLSRERLDQLAEIKGLSTTTMLEVLINAAYEIDCLGENGEELY